MKTSSKTGEDYIKLLPSKVTEITSFAIWLTSRNLLTKI